MEVCGGHTHAIFRYGIEGMLPEQIELVHGPGCPVCVLPMGRIDDCIAIASEPGVILTTFGDAMRVPGSRGSLLQAKAERRRYPHGVFAVRRAGTRARKSGSRGGVLRSRLRDHDAVHRADGAGSGTRRDRQFLGVLQPHHDRADHQGDPRQSRSADRRLPRARPRVDGDRHRALRVHRAALSQAAGGVGLRAARRAAIALDGAAPDRRWARGGGEPVCTRGRRRRQRGGTARDRHGLRTARVLRMARPRLDRLFRRPLPRCLCAVRCRTPLRGAWRAHRRPAVLPVRRGAEGRAEAAPVQGVRHRLHAGDAARRADGVVRRRLRRLLPLRREARA